MIFPLLVVFQNLIQRGYVGELTEWNGCFNIRGKSLIQACLVYMRGVWQLM